MGVEIMTETNGRQILTGLAETRKFFEQVSMLIRTAEDILRDEGWEAVFGNKCADVTSHLYHPKKWMPSEVYRFFVAGEDSEVDKDKVLFIGVLLEDKDGWGGFQEPWVTCGLYQFNVDKDVSKSIDWSWVTTHLYDKYDADGTFQDYECSPEDQDEYRYNSPTNSPGG